MRIFFIKFFIKFYLMKKLEMETDKEKNLKFFKEKFKKWDLNL